MPVEKSDIYIADKPNTANSAVYSCMVICPECGEYVSYAVNLVYGVNYRTVQCFVCGTVIEVGE